MLDLVVSLVLVVATATGVGMIVPQVVRLHRTRNAAGVSAGWIGVSFVLNVSWLTYGWAVGLFGLLPVSAGGTLLYGVMAVQVTRINGSSQLVRFALAAAAGALIPTSGFILGGWAGAGLATGLAYGGQFTPAAVSALRSADLSGVSVLTWQLAFIEAVCWVVYALAASDVPLLVGGGGGLVVSAVILGALSRYRRGPALARPALAPTAV